MRSPASSIVFKVSRREPELIAPAKPTPHELKPLSDIDDQEGFRAHLPVIQIYRHHSAMQGKDPVKVIREAIGKALVFYYPFAGRLREGPNRKLTVECTGEGVLFIEADADFELEHSGNVLQPPFHFLDEFLFDVPGSSGIINCPLLLIQVTRLKCGGFVFALRFNHTMTDGSGLVQFMTSIGELARGELSPRILPVWERQVLSARNPPRTTCIHREYDDFTTAIPFPLDDLVDQAFFFGPNEIAILRSYVPPHLRHCTTMEIVTACLWKCRTIALQSKPMLEMRILIANNTRKKFSPDLIPKGYYGNGFMISTAVATAGELVKNSIGYALELIRKTKAEMTREYVQSAADTLVIKGRPCFPVEGSYGISDLRNLGFREVDFGWGKAIYGGVAKAIPILVSYYVAYENEKGENGFVLLACLPAQVMERFAEELQNLLQGAKPFSDGDRLSPIVKSAL
ncbi:benzyl alcohol O-benzoyltransferase-like isoform X2 [Mercurialis annua]|uniref:benzyl alcohol O-benzoyltransferase-like isoform X2 n=1 Tax=Mercurialis annua TaxID=3986 RepID=UPI00215E32BE|nr:benzyl alcohol O-benzoyltransferase-like isoform X2 [Mercurialis annua]